MINRPKFTLLSAICILVLILTYAACDVTDEAHSDTGQLTVHLTDAPGDYEAVWVDIQEVRIKSENHQSTENPKAGDNGWIKVNDAPVRVNLLELRNGNTIKLGSEELDAGTYHQIRLVLGPDNEVVVNETTHPLATPSADESGVKLDINAEIEEGEIYNLLIDFDASRSIVEAESGSYLLKPVLRAVNLDQTGSISGMIQPTDVQTSVMAISNGDTLSTLTGQNGDFSIMGVAAGSYDVTFQPRNNSYHDTTLQNISVESEQKVSLEPVTLR